MGIFKTSLFKRKWTPRNRRRISHVGVLIAAGGLFTLIIALIQPFYTFNLWFSDRFSSSGTFSPNIVIAGIDDTTLAKNGKWSEWPRSLNAQAVNNLESAGASVIGFDILFNTSSNNDQAFAQSLQQADNIVLAGAGTTAVATRAGVISFVSFLLPDSILYQADSNVGHVNIFPGPDGKVRQIPLLVQNDGNFYPALSISTLLTLFREKLPDSYPIVNGKLNILMRDIPVNSSYSMNLNYTVVDSKPTYISYGDIVDDNFDPFLVKNKIILIGMTATGNSDQWPVSNLEQQAKLKGQLEGEVSKLKADKVSLEAHLVELVKHEKSCINQLQKKQIELGQLEGLIGQEQYSLQGLKQQRAVIEKEISERQTINNNLYEQIKTKQNKIADLTILESKRNDIAAECAELEVKAKAKKMPLMILEALEGYLQSSSPDKQKKFVDLLPALLEEASQKKYSPDFIRAYILNNLTGGTLTVFKCTSCGARFSSDKPGGLLGYQCPSCCSYRCTLDKDEVKILRELLGYTKPKNFGPVISVTLVPSNKVQTPPDITTKSSDNANYKS